MSSFEALAVPLCPSVLAWAALRLGPKARRTTDPEDLVQEVIARAWERFPTFDPERASFRRWLFGIATNVLREILRARTAGPLPGTDSRSFAGSGTCEIERVTTSIVRRIARREELGTLIQVVEAFSSEERRLLLYHGLEGLTLAEAATLLKISREAANKRWQRLVAKLAGIPVYADLIAADRI